MKNSIFTLLLLFYFSFSLHSQGENGTLMELNVADMQQIIQQVPEKGSNNFSSRLLIMTLPMPSGEEIDFFVRHAPMVDAKSPLYNTTAGSTYNLNAVEAAGYSGAMVAYPDGIHATLHTPDGLLFIKRTEQINRHRYVYFKDTEGFPHSPDDAVKADGLATDDENETHSHGIGEETHSHGMPRLANNNFYVVGNQDKRVLDLFITSESDFLNLFGGNTTNATNRVVEIVNGVRAIWEKDFNLTINYMGVFFNNGSLNGSLANAATAFNNATDADVSGGTKADVDIAHFLTGNGGGGAAYLWSACGNLKSGGYSGSTDVSGTGFVGLVAHEMAHHLGADHTWTGSAGSCSASQYGQASGVEPGAGISLASYAGICDSDNLPGGGKGDFHHTESIREIVEYIVNGKGKDIQTAPAVNQIPAFTVNYSASCIGTTSNLNSNNVPVANSNPGNLTNLNIPARTPFELEGAATDADGDPLTYQWDQLDFATSQASLDGYATRADGPLFRSFGPKSSPKREFPQLSDILAGSQTGGEILPQVNRRMRFALVARDGKGGVGVDTVGFNVVDSGQGFAVSESINTSNPSSITVAWDVAGTNAGLINCGTVDIMYSTDGGQTFPYVLAQGTANDGSEVIDFSNFPGTTIGRIKVKCSTSIFFDINNANLSINIPQCIDNSTTYTGSGDVTADAGDASLNLSLSPQYGSQYSNFTGDVTASDVASNLAYSNASTTGGPCAGPSNPNYYESHTIYPTTTGNHTFNISAPFGQYLAVYTGDFNPQSVCTGFVGSSVTNPNPGGNLSLSSTLTVNLTTGLKYTLVIGTFSQNTNYYGNYSVTFSGGSLYNGKPSASGYTYTYVAVNSSNVISKIDAGADFSSGLAGGGAMYTVYGFSVRDSDLANFNGQAGQSFANFFNGTYCAASSSNTIKLTINGNDVMPGKGEGTCIAGDTVEPSEIPGTAGTYNYNSSTTLVTSGAVEINSGYDVTYTAGTSVTLNEGFHAKAGSVFLAKIGSCTPALQEEEPETAYRFSSATPSVKELDLTIAPNPSRDFTNLTFSLVKPSQVNMVIYDMSGRAVESLIQGQTMDAGQHQIQYVPQNVQGGMYYVLLQADAEVITKKMILVR